MNTQTAIDFEMIGYSYATSKPAYDENAKGKDAQARLILSHVKQGVDCLLRLAEITHIPQSTVSGRVNDLIKAKRVKYEGFTVYGRKRKKIVAL